MYIIRGKYLKGINNIWASNPLSCLFYFTILVTSDVLMSIQTNHKAHNYIFNTACEMLTASQSYPEASVKKKIKMYKKSILHNEVFLRCVYIFSEGSVYCCDLH